MKLIQIKSGNFTHYVRSNAIYHILTDNDERYQWLVRIHLKDGASIVINNLPSKKEADDFISWLAEQIDSDVQSKEQ